MCVIIYKPKGVAMPSQKELKAAFAHNSDGAGFAYFLPDNRVQIVKGLMTFAALEKALKRHSGAIKDNALVIHMRITTHGGTSQGLTHPFPVSSDPQEMHKIDNVADTVVFHNGIISIKPREGQSDTTEYILSVMSVLREKDPKFAENAAIRYMIETDIYSKMLIMYNNKVYMIGSFVLDNGIYYSNRYYAIESNYIYRNSILPYTSDTYTYGRDYYEYKTQAKIVSVDKNYVICIGKYNTLYLRNTTESTYRRLSAIENTNYKKYSDIKYDEVKGKELTITVRETYKTANTSTTNTKTSYSEALEYCDYETPLKFTGEKGYFIDKWNDVYKYDEKARAFVAVKCPHSLIDKTFDSIESKAIDMKVRYFYAEASDSISLMNEGYLNEFY